MPWEDILWQHELRPAPRRARNRRRRKILAPRIRVRGATPSPSQSGRSPGPLGYVETEVRNLCGSGDCALEVQLQNFISFGPRDFRSVRIKVGLAPGFRVGLSDASFTAQIRPDAIGPDVIGIEVAEKLTEEIGHVSSYSLSEDVYEQLASSLENDDFLGFGTTILGLLDPNNTLRLNLPRGHQVDIGIDADPDLCFFVTELELGVIGFEIDVAGHSVPVTVTGTLRLHWGLSPLGYYQLARRIGGEELLRRLGQAIRFLAAQGYRIAAWSVWARSVLPSLGWVGLIVVGTAAISVGTFVTAGALIGLARERGLEQAIFLNYSISYVRSAYHERFGERRLQVNATPSQSYTLLERASQLGWNDARYAVKMAGPSRVHSIMENHFGDGLNLDDSRDRRTMGHNMARFLVQRHRFIPRFAWQRSGNLEY